MGIRGSNRAILRGLWNFFYAVGIIIYILNIHKEVLTLCVGVLGALVLMVLAAIVRIDIICLEFF